MALSLVRIDDRLVHGQVVEGWVPHLKADLVLVASDAAAADETLVMLMRMALPDKVELQVLPVDRAARHPDLAEGSRRKVLVLAPGPKEVLALLERGASFSKVNVGGLHYTAGKVQLGKAIYLSEEDLAALRAISGRGVKLEGRALPGEKEIDLLDLIEAQK